jgi:hypothetical protein
MSSGDSAGGRHVLPSTHQERGVDEAACGGRAAAPVEGGGTSSAAASGARPGDSPAVPSSQSDGGAPPSVQEGASGSSSAAAHHSPYAAVCDALVAVGWTRDGAYRLATMRDEDNFPDTFEGGLTTLVSAALSARAISRPHPDEVIAAMGLDVERVPADVRWLLRDGKHVPLNILVEAAAGLADAAVAEWGKSGPSMTTAAVPTSTPSSSSSATAPQTPPRAQEAQGDDEDAPQTSGSSSSSSSASPPPADPAAASLLVDIATTGAPPIMMPLARRSGRSHLLHSAQLIWRGLGDAPDALTSDAVFTAYFLPLQA